MSGICIIYLIYHVVLPGARMLSTETKLLPTATLCGFFLLLICNRFHQNLRYDQESYNIQNKLTKCISDTLDLLNLHLHDANKSYGLNSFLRVCLDLKIVVVFGHNIDVNLTGDLEKKFDLEISPMCNQQADSIPAVQIGEPTCI